MSRHSRLLYLFTYRNIQPNQCACEQINRDSGILTMRGGDGSGLLLGVKTEHAIISFHAAWLPRSYVVSLTSYLDFALSAALTLHCCIVGNARLGRVEER